MLNANGNIFSPLVRAVEKANRNTLGIRIETEYQTEFLEPHLQFSRPTANQGLGLDRQAGNKAANEQNKRFHIRQILNTLAQK